MAADTCADHRGRSRPNGFAAACAAVMLALGTILGLPVAAAAASSDAALALDGAIARYRALLLEDVDRTVAGAQALRARIADQDLDGARQAWLASRVGWERSEVFTSGFVPELDRNIDAWPNGTTGFHAIEARLFGIGRTDAAQETEALLQDLSALQTQVRTITLTPQGLLDGITRLAYEVGESKIDGGESRISGTSIDDMRNNIGGIDLAWRTVFATALAGRDGAAAAEVQHRIDDLKTMFARDDLRHLDPDKLRAASEQLVLALQTAAPHLALSRPTLE